MNTATVLETGAFALGTIVQTRGAQAELSRDEVLAALQRHVTGDWGNVCEEDRQTNNEAITSGSRLLSSYTSKSGTDFWIITEADRSTTTILLPEEY
ncbi:MAG TPA: hypothetical protein VEH27_17575 [Methylomirabilota bacterium]|nr:hypothetical protein [Methylomirabilota bacterium]